mgnify:CR=1 FL=1
MTSKMTKDQREYAVERAKQLVNRKRSAALKALGAAPKPPKSYTTAEKIKMIENGTATFKGDPNSSRHDGPYGYVVHFFEYPLRPGDEAATKKVEEYKAKAAAAAELFEEELEEVIDQLMLADADGALQALKDFESKLNKKAK